MDLFLGKGVGVLSEGLSGVCLKTREGTDDTTTHLRTSPAKERENRPRQDPRTEGRAGSAGTDRRRDETEIRSYKFYQTGLGRGVHLESQVEEGRDFEVTTERRMFTSCFDLFQSEP